MDVNGMVAQAHYLRPNLETITYRVMGPVDVWTPITVNAVKRDPRPKTMPVTAPGGTIVDNQKDTFHALVIELPDGFEGRYKDQIIAADGSWWSVDRAFWKTTGNIWAFECTNIAPMS